MHAQVRPAGRVCCTPGACPRPDCDPVSAASECISPRADAYRATPAGAAALSGAWEYFVARHEGERVPCENWNAKVKGADGRCRTAPAVDWEERTFNMMLLRHSIGLGDEQAPPPGI